MSYKQLTVNLDERIYPQLLAFLKLLPSERCVIVESALSPQQPPAALAPRPLGQYVGKMQMSEDFCAPLPEEFWLGEMEIMSIRKIKVQTLRLL